MRLNVLPPHLLRLYVWALLDANDVLELVPGQNGKMLIPVAPVSDEPDLRNAGKAYIIYGFAENEYTRLPVVHTGTLSMRVIAPTFAELSAVIATLQMAFEIEDEAAGRVNEWTTDQTALQGCAFTSICVTYIEAADANEQEGGPLEGLVNLRYNYIIEKSITLP